jgi:hypothetical protein
VNRNFAYEGDKCVVPENCVENTKCENTRCQCIDNSFTTKNGLCCMLKIWLILVFLFYLNVWFSEKSEDELCKS